MSVIKLGLWCTFISICQSPSYSKSVSCAPSTSTSASAHFHFPFRPLAIGSLISIVSVARAANKMSRCGHDKHLLAALLCAWLRCPVCWKSYWFSAVERAAWSEDPSVCVSVCVWVYKTHYFIYKPTINSCLCCSLCLHLRFHLVLCLFSLLFAVFTLSSAVSFIILFKPH